MKKAVLLSLLFLFCFCKQQKQNVQEEDIDEAIMAANKMLDRTSSNLNVDNSISLFTKAEKESETISYKKGIMESNKYLMTIYYSFIQDNKKSLDHGYKAEKIALELNNEQALSQIHEFRGGAFLDMGLIKESHDELQKALALSRKNQNHLRLSSIYLKMLLYTEKTNAPQDTILAYLNKSLHEAERIKDNDQELRSPDEKYYQISYIHTNMGMFYTGIYKPQQPELAEKHLLDALFIFEKRKLSNPTSQISALNALGRFYEATNQPQKAVPYAAKALKLEKGSQQLEERLTAFMVLANSYDTLKEKDSTIKYTQLYSHLSDSLAIIQKKEVNTTLNKISIQKEKSYQANTQRIIAIALTSILILIVSGWLYIRSRNKTARGNYEKLIKKLKTDYHSSVETIEEVEKKIPTTLQISEETQNSILAKLERFENSNRYLKKNISLSSLSHSLNTNQRYLTEIIKTHRGKSFSNYINGLRIDYITHKLYEAPQYREYKISYLAEECGFASHQAFIRVFKQETGVTPSYFIEKFKSQKQKL